MTITPFVGDGPEAAPRHTPRVLIVDDDPHMATQLAELLTDLEIEVVGTVNRGENVLPAMRRVAADVVVMDVRMPGRIDGLQATRLLAEHFPAVAVVLHTAFAGQLGEQAWRVGAVAEIAKGAHPYELVAAIQRAFQSVPAKPCTVANSHGLVIGSVIGQHSATDTPTAAR